MKEENLVSKRPIGRMAFIVLMISCVAGTLRTLMIPLAKELVGPAIPLTLMTPILLFGLMKSLGDIALGYESIARFRVILGIGSLSYFLGALELFRSVCLLELVMASSLLGFGEGIIHSGFYLFLTQGRRREISGTLIGTFEGIVYVGYGIGAILAGYASIAYGLKNAFLLMLPLSAASFATLVSIGGIRVEAKRSDEHLKRFLKRGSVLTSFLVAHMSKLSDALMWGVLPLFLLAGGTSWIGIGYVQSAIMFSFALFTILFGNFSDRVGRRLSTFIGIGVSMAGVVGCFLKDMQVSPIVFGTLFGAGTAMFYPVLPAVISDSIPEGLRGRCLSMYRGVRDLGYFSGAILLGSILSGFGETVTLILVIMLLLSSMVLSTIYLRETRPAWSTYPLHLEHAKILEEGLAEFRNSVRELVAGNHESYRTHASRFKELERTMDELKYRVQSEIWRSVVDRDRADMLRIVSSMDMVITHLLESISRFSFVWDEVPSSIRLTILEASEKIVLVGRLLREVVQNMRIYPEEGLKIIRRIDEEERDYDELHLKQLEELYKCRSVLDPVSALMVSEAIESMEYAMDELHEASHLIYTLMSKYFYV